MTGRIRTVKPEWLEDELLGSCSDAAAKLSIGLLLLADDYGNGRASLAQIAASVWRYQLEQNDGANAPEVLAKASGAFRELVAMHFIGVYEVSGQKYFAIRNWKKHQRVDKPGKPLVPARPPTLFDAESLEGNPNSGEPRESGANPPRAIPETPAPDPRPTTTTTTTTTTGDHDAGPVAPPVIVNWDERETPCPLDLVEKLKTNGVHVELAEALKIDVESVLWELREFVSYWTIGEGTGKRRRHWAAKARERVRKRHAEGMLKPPGAIDHAQGRGGDVQSEVDRALAKSNYKPPVSKVAS